jgi:hypothetical protein
VTFINAVIQNFAGDTKERVADYEQWKNYHMLALGQHEECWVGAAIRGWSLDLSFL